MSIHTSRKNKTVKNYADFAIIDFLDHYEVDCKDSGNNVGRNWIGVEECVFCGCSGYHMAVNRQSKKVSCWSCGESSMIPRFVKELLRIEWKEVFEVIKRFGGDDQEFDFRETGNETILPSNLLDVSGAGLKYLENRGFTQHHVDKYHLKMTNHHSTLTVGDQTSIFGWRIIFPIIMSRKLVSYTGRDYTGKQGRYKNPFLEACVISSSSAIFNYDSLKKGQTGIILEGPTDAMRMGDQTCSLQGIKHTKEQVRYLAESDVKNFLICYDSSAYEKSRNLADSLSGLCGNVKIIKLLTADDPASLSDFEAVRLKKELLSL